MTIMENKNNNSLSYLLPYLKPYKLQIIFAIIGLIISSSSVLAFGKGLSYLIDYAFKNNNLEILNQALIILFFVVITLALAIFTRLFFVNYVSENVICDLRRDLYKHLVKLSLKFFETNKAGDILSRLTTDTEMIQLVVSSSFSLAMRNSLTFIGGLILLFHTSTKLTLMVLIVVPLVVLPIIILGKKLKILSKKSQEKISLLASFVEETINGIKTIAAFCREPYEISLFNNMVKDSNIIARKRIKLRAILTALVISLVFSSIGFVMWVGGSDVIKGTMSAGDLSSFVFYAILVAGSFASISEVISDINRASGAMERITDFLNTKESITQMTNPLHLPEKLQGEINFTNVSFAYPANQDKYVIENISFIIKPRQTIAIVGSSGAGKTTLFQLLLRFYDLNSGKISIDGIDIKSVPIEELRNIFAVVPQDPTMFSCSVKENILLGKTEASTEEVVRAAKAAAAFEFIEKMPQKFEQFIGEKGVRLSGGQKQRIAIARAFLKNPKILLLDEATSSLDSENESLIHEALQNLMKDRTTIVIAHRLSTVQKADIILVMDNGKIIEQGTHSELIEKNGLYNKMLKMQIMDNY